MKKASLTMREVILLVLLAVLIIGVVYYMAFYSPMQDELASIRQKTADLENQVSVNASKLANMNAMQAELDAIFALPESEITEIAPYDNAKVVMNQLNGILASSEEYKLTFSDPKFGEDGIVRRDVSLTFYAENYANAKKIIDNLSNSHWRCLINSVSVQAKENVRKDILNVSATLTFFESTKLAE